MTKIMGLEGGLLIQNSSICVNFSLRDVYAIGDIALILKVGFFLREELDRDTRYR